MKFYGLPLNYGSERSYSNTLFVPEVQDLKLSTSWKGTTIQMYVDADGDGTGSPRQFDTAYIVCKGADSFDFTWGGSKTASGTVVDEVSDNYGRMLPVVDAYGFHHILFSFPSKITASSITITFDSSAEVARVWILDEDNTIQISNDARFTQLNFDDDDRGASTKKSGNNVMHYISGFGDPDEKTDITATCRFRPKHNSYLFLKKFFKDNKRGFVCAVDYPAERSLVKQYVVDPKKSLRPISQYKYAGKDYTFSLIER